ncbi:hypothetical protein [Deinococcus sonorensis]|uniref:Uncharacterized protein n=2 Tax=Deinococcus sonorensis TaxID=309891 RepID=A0AAU7UFB8_9DEIO
MDLSTHRTAASALPLTLNVTVAPDPSAAVPAAGEPLLQLRALEHAGDPELQRDRLKTFLTAAAARQVQRLLRHEPGADAALDLCYPADAPNWWVRLEQMDEGGARLVRYDVDSQVAGAEQLELSAEQAQALAERLDSALLEREQASLEVHADGDLGGQNSPHDHTRR